MAEMLGYFSFVVGIALLLTGIGFVILAIAVFGKRKPETGAAPEAAPAPGS